MSPSFLLHFGAGFGFREPMCCDQCDRAGTSPFLEKADISHGFSHEEAGPSVWQSILAFMPKPCLEWQALRTVATALNLIIIESKNIPSWKGPVRIIKSNSWLHTGLPKNQTGCLMHLRTFWVLGQGQILPLSPASSSIASSNPTNRGK